jgi:phosphoserine aminotransferase
MSTATLSDRVVNFSAGPAVLPVPVLEQIADEMLCLPGVGASIMEISHRSEAFVAIYESAKSRVKRLLAIPDDYEILFLQGGAKLQFSMTAMNLMPGFDAPAEYLLTGTWGKGALSEAKKIGSAQAVFTAADTNFDRLPSIGDYTLDPTAPFVHITSNETIQGVQFEDLPETGNVPLVSDCSSDIFCRPMDIQKYGLIYACAQKNAGPAGVTLVVVRKDLLDRANEDLPGYLRYQNHAESDSMWNTPPTFAIYVLDLVAKWLEESIGGLEKMQTLNQSKSQMLYELIDKYPDLYVGHSQPNSRSIMNVTFRFNDDATEKRFLVGAKERKLESLKGHRSVGGIRASLYNAMPIEGVEALASYMSDFAKS